ncbi:MAG: alpha/beta hydrolase [Chloroflexi bacterium]|nr:alpha/beta hydrolase [Chloroflexota bacterium]
MPEQIVNGLRIYYDERGAPDGPAILFIPGLGSSHLSWGGVTRHIPPSYRIIVVDPRDAGRSERTIADYTVGDMAEDIAGLLQGLNVKKTAVVGISMGGAIAQELAIRYPDRVERAVLVATYDSGDSRGTFIFEQFARLRRLLSKEDYYRTILPWIYTHQEFESIAPDQAVKQFAQDPFFQDPDTYERQMRATIAYRSRDRLGLITCPTLVIFGDEDMFTPLRFARSLQAGIRNSRLVVVSGAGHGIIWTRIVEVASLIANFMKEPPPKKQEAAS